MVQYLHFRILDFPLNKHRACCNSKLRTLRGKDFEGFFLDLKQREPRLVRPTALVDIGSFTMYPEETNVAREKPWLDMGNPSNSGGFPPLGELSVPENGVSKTKRHLFRNTIWLFSSSPWKDPPFLSSANHLFLWAIYTMAMLVITRGYIPNYIPLDPINSH